MRPLCKDCRSDLFFNLDKNSWHCENTLCAAIGLSQKIDEAVQPKTPNCACCCEGNKLALNNQGLYHYCKNTECVEFGLARTSFEPEAYKKPEQAVKGKTGADTIKERESVYGPFAVHAEAEQALKAAMYTQPGWTKLNVVQKSAADMIVHKLARILNGSANYDDNWHDIAGYATLAEQDIHKSDSKTKT